MLEIDWGEFPKLVLNHESRIKVPEVEYFGHDSFDWDPDCHPSYRSYKMDLYLNNKLLTYLRIF